MSKPIDILMEEHRTIEKVLDALASFARAVEGSGEDRKSAGQFAEFFRMFADRCHHGKEEDILFKELQAIGMPADDGPIGVMLHEHEIGRNCVRAIGAVADGSGEWSPDESDGFRHAVAEFIPMLRAHIQKEDHVLFPTADGMLSAEKVAELGDQFAVFCDNNLGKEVHNGLLALADELSERWKG